MQTELSRIVAPRRDVCAGHLSVGLTPGPTSAFSFLSIYHRGVSATTEHTVFPADTGRGLAALLSALQTTTPLAIETADGRSFPLTPELRDVLIHASHALSEGLAVTLEPQSVVLSTQEAADLLGVSRPTLVKLPEAGEIPYTQPGRHRRVQLPDLLAYQQQIRHHRRVTLDTMSAEAAADDAYGRLDEFGGTR